MKNSAYPLPLFPNNRLVYLAVPHCPFFPSVRCYTLLSDPLLPFSSLTPSVSSPLLSTSLYPLSPPSHSPQVPVTSFFGSVVSTVPWSQPFPFKPFKPLARTTSPIPPPPPPTACSTHEATEAQDACRNPDCRDGSRGGGSGSGGSSSNRDVQSAVVFRAHTSSPSDKHNAQMAALALTVLLLLASLATQRRCH